MPRNIPTELIERRAKVSWYTNASQIADFLPAANPRFPGSHTVTVKAEDAAGNWSASSNADVVTGYAC